MTAPTAARVAALVLAALLCGCSTLKQALAPGEVIAPAQAAASGAADSDGAEAAGEVPVLVVQAPQPLRGVLEQHLDLAQAIRSPQARLLSNAEWARLAAAAPAQAHTLAQTEGYFDALASVAWENVDEPREPGQPRVVLSVEPGAHTHVGRITFEVQGELADAMDEGNADARTLWQDVQHDWALGQGKVFRNAAWENAKAAVLTQLRAQGYAAATWAGTGAEVDAADHSVRLFLVADSGPLFRAGAIEVSGTQHHDAERVRMMADFKPGDALTEARLLDFQTRLLKSGLFDQAAVLLEPDASQAAAAPIKVTVRETPLQSATVSLGYAANAGPGVKVEYAHRLPFGRPLITRHKVQLSRAYQAWDGDVTTHMDAEFNRWLLGGTLERYSEVDDTQQGLRLRLGRLREVPNHDRLIFAEVEGARACTGVDGTRACGSTWAVSGNVHHILRRLDNNVLPTDGWALNLQAGLGYTSGNATGSGPFSRLYGRATGFWPLTFGERTWYAQARVEAGAVLARDGVTPPESQRFRAGGDESVRGYGWRTLAPTADGVATGGAYLLTASAEVARPLFDDLPMLLGAVFIDAGDAVNSWRDYRPALGVGAGVRVRSPIGPLKVDLAWGQEDQALRLHLSLGITF